MRPGPRLASLGLVLLILAACAAAALAAGVVGSEDSIDPVPLPALVAHGGPNAAWPHRAFAVVRDQAQLERLWARLLGERVETSAQGWSLVPRVDFERCMVVAVLHGPTVHANAEQLVEAWDHGDRVVVRFDTITYQVSQRGADDPPSPTVHPYGVFVLPRRDVPVHVEENVQGMRGPPDWRRRATIGFPHAMGGWVVPGASQRDAG